MAKKMFMAKAVRHPGALRAAAKRVGKSTTAYCASPPNAKAAKRCNLMRTFARFRPKGGAAHRAARKGARTRARGSRET